MTMMDDGDKNYEKVEGDLDRWYKNARDDLDNDRRIPSRCEFKMIHIEDEIVYWETRLITLKSIIAQRPVIEKLELLKRNDSAFVDMYTDMIDLIEGASAESRSNLNYLRVLRQPCADLYDVEIVDDVQHMVPGILKRILFVAMESPHYSQKFHFDQLCDFLGNQIVYTCRRTMDIATVLDPGVESPLPLILACVDCCHSFIDQYKHMVQTINELRPEVKLWMKAKNTYEFIRRCDDLQYLLRAISIFKGFEKEPVNPGSPEDGLGIERYFDKIMDDLKQDLATIFDVTDSNWTYCLKIFQNKLNHLCNDMQEQVYETFYYVACDEIERMDMFQNLNNFFEWEHFRINLQRKIQEVCVATADQLTTVIESFEGYQWNEYPYMPRHSGVCIVTASAAIAKTVEKLKLEIAECLSLTDNPVSIELNNIFDWWDETHHGVITNSLTSFWDKVDRNFKLTLDKNILASEKTSKHGSVFTVNLDRVIQSAFSDIKYINLINQPIPIDCLDFTNESQKTELLHKNVTILLKHYNNFVADLSEHEVPLFSRMVNKYFKTIIIRLAVVHVWSYSETVLNKYLVKCYNGLEQLKKTKNVFKHCDAEIAKLCETMTNLLLVDENRATEMVGYEEITSHTKINARVKLIIQQYNMIITYATIIYNGFGSNIHYIKSFWAHYVDTIDESVLMALRVNVKRSLENLLVQLHLPKLIINVSLEDRQIVMAPSKVQLKTYFENIRLNISSALSFVPRLCQTLKINTIPDPTPYSDAAANYPMSRNLQTAVVQTIDELLREIEVFLNEILTYSDIWTRVQDEYLKEFKGGMPTADVYSQTIDQFQKKLTMFEFMDATLTLPSAVVRFDGIRSQIMHYCRDWIDNLSALLLAETSDTIDGFYEYMETNGDRVNLPPKTLIELVEYTAFQKQLVLDAVDKQNEIDLISQYIIVLKEQHIKTTQTMDDKYAGLWDAWKVYMNRLNEAEFMLREKQKDFKGMLKLEQDKFMKEVEQFRLYWEEFKETESKNEDLVSVDALNGVRKIEQIYEKMKERQNKLMDDLQMLNLKFVPLSGMEIIKEIKLFEDIFMIVEEWDTMWDKYKTGNFWKINISEMEVTVQSIFKELNSSMRSLKAEYWIILKVARDSIDKIRRVLPLISDLKNPAMYTRHWNEVREAINVNFSETDPKFTLEYIMEIKMQDFGEQIGEISKKATMELNIENTLKSIKETWTTMTLNVEPFNDENIYRIKSSDDITTMLEDQLVQLYSMKGSKYISIFAKEADYWTKGLSLVRDVLEMTLTVQRQYAYAEKIFKADDVRNQIPNELRTYQAVSVEWSKITTKMFIDNNAYRACHSKPLLNRLNKINKQLEDIQKALELYMETKRKVFPRFYFISNDDLLDILANAKSPKLLQPHFKKCFDNINKIQIEGISDDALGMYSADGEYVEWSIRAKSGDLVEQWFKQIEFAMRVSLKDIFQKTLESLQNNPKKRDEWILLWPGQLCITASQIEWTTNCTTALLQAKTINSKKPLKKIRSKQKKILLKFSDAIRGKLTKVDRLKIVALVTIEIHARDVIDKMYKSNCMDESDFEWMSQLRFYWDSKKKKIAVRQTHTKQPYGYEYLGNSGRLVITPLTDRCYITLTTALHLFRGGSPKGPAGTGKTETVKDLGKNLAYYVIVINCSDGLDYKSMGRMFSGLAQQGAWGCFDEFNRINIEVLSVVAQQVLSIYAALAKSLRKFIFDGEEIDLVPTCGLFITMNPGYAGRTELPDNLKSLFRAISMMVPDTKLIAEIMLFGEGFRDTRNLANKVFVLFSLCRQQLSKQDHYEFGLRGLVALLRYAGQCRRQYPKMPHDQVLLLAMYNMNLAKLTVDDLPLFIGITRDLFPKITLPTVKNDVLTDAIMRCMSKSGHQPAAPAIAKIVQLYETKISRHSVMILGQTGAAKTSTWKTLRDTMLLLKRENVDTFETVIEYPLNPKSLTLGELYGEYNLATQEWTDGVLSSLMRMTCSDTGTAQKWIIFDGPVDAIWIENMNSVMDDNKVLTLINSERITMPEQVSLLFEVEDLAVASPATVSRCGIIYNDYKDFGWKLYFESWLSKCEFNTYRDNIRTNFHNYIDTVLEFKRLNCTETVPLPELSCIQSLCKLLESFTFDGLAIEVPGDMDSDKYTYVLRLWFLFCMVWSVCAVVNENGRVKIDQFLRGLMNDFPVGDSVYHYYVDQNMGQFRHWDIFLRNDNWSYTDGTPFFKIIVPTVDTVRYNYVVEALMSRGQPVLLVGPVGTGKTSTVQKVLDALDKNKCLILTINMSAQTTAHNIQETLDGRLEKRTKDLYMPLANKSLITFLDDMNMPEKEVYGAQPPLELIRQWIDYGFWYDRNNRLLKNVKNMMLIGAMGPPGGGRNTISNRLTSRFSMINLTFPEETQISNIFNSMLNQHMKPFEEYLRNMRFTLTEMTITLYNRVVANLLPTPTKMHYLFNLRDISKVFQGLLRSTVDCQKNVESMLRLWCNEVFRVFNDKLIDEKDQDWFMEQINLLLGKHYEQTYRNLCSSDRTLMFCDFLNNNSIYEEITDENRLRRFVDDSLDQYNSSAGSIPLNLVLFKDAINHICRINRVISQPRGYILLVGIGGSGRSSLAKVANWLCDYKMFTIELTKTYGVADFKEDLKRLYYETGVKDQPTSFLFNDTQIANEMFLEIINNILSTGEVAKLYKEEDFEEIKDALSAVAKKAGVPETNDEMYSFFLDRVRGNMHLIICLSPIGNKFRMRLRQYPSLINCTTIDWFLDWPKDALLEVAFRSLSTIEILETITGAPRVFEVDSEIPTEKELKLSIANLFSIIHHSVANYSNIMLLELKRYNYVTPTNYLELVSGYKESLRLKRIEIGNIANKLRNGLYKIDDTNKKVAGMTVELEKATETVTKYTIECDEFLEIIVGQTIKADQKKNEVDEQSITIKQEEAISQDLYVAAVTDLQKAMPALEEAMEALNSLNKKDLAEVKSFSTPPPRVKLVLEALMIFRQSEPTWTEAKRQLGDPNFLTQLKEFDKDHVPPKVLKKIGPYTKNPEFEPEKVGAQSIAAKSLAQWVIAIEKYAIIYKFVAPKKEAADDALASLKNKQLALANAQKTLLELQKLLLTLENDFNKKMKEKEELVKKAEGLKRNLERAASLIDGLSGERIRWTETVKQLDIAFDYLPGDCLLGIAFVSYMGPFVFKYREILLKLWIQSVKNTKIPNNPHFEIKAFLSDPAIIRHWNIHGLPYDDFSTENGIIISQSSRWPLIIDPQCQALKWIKKMEADNNLQFIDFCLPNYMKILENALSLGYPTLLQITSENIEPAIMPVLSKSIVTERGQLYMKMGDKDLPYNNNFRFFITTKIRNPYYPPEIFTRAAVINFAIKEEGLEDQLLDVVITMEKPQLKILKDNLIINIASGKKTLVELEDELLRLLNEIKGSLLENEELFHTLGSSKITSANINKQLESSLITQTEIDYAREGYRSCAKRASILFFVLNELNQIDPMYQFSLDSYMDLFQNSIRKSEKNAKLDQRLENLNYYHTYAVYKNTCRGLFEVHKLLFSFQLCISLLLAESQLSLKEIEFLFKGGIVLNKKEQTENPCKSWLPASNWDNISELDKMPGFLGIEKSFDQFSREWKEWYMSPNPETLSLIDKWDDNTNEFQKMLFVRSLRLDRLSFAISNFIASQLDPRFIEPPVLDVKQALEDSSNKTPLIFLLSPGVDPTNMLLSVASSTKTPINLQSLSLGQGQAPIATKLIELGQVHGDWVFLANCHLSLSWMPQLDKIVELMQDGKSHPNFRLWLSSNPDPDFPIAILQSAIKMTTEPPKGLKANMKRLYNNMTDVQFSKCFSQDKYTKLLFSLCFFHSILIERKKFQSLGWNVVYSFNDSDFEVSENLLSIYLDKYADTPWDALKYLISGICYGGQVTDDWDRRLLDTYINQYFNENAITTPYYRLSSSLKYYIPKATTIESYASFIDTLPNVDGPEAFGQHSNAEMASLMEVNRMVCEILLSLQGQSATVAEENKEEKVLVLCSEILNKIPALIDYDTTVKNIGAKRGPLNVVLLQEISRYNILLKELKVSLVGLKKGIKGLVVMSSDLEEVFQCVYEGRVPGPWLKAYPSVMTLGSWTQDLIDRVNHFTVWADKLQPPVLFWLGAYTYPTSFLTAVLQIHSRSSSIPIDLLNWEFTPITIPEMDIAVPPQDGVYVRNLYLEGANWNFEKSCICEPVPLKFIAQLPVIQFQPVLTASKKRGYYPCPVYYYPQRCGTQGRDSFVVVMNLNSGSETPDYWVKKATAVLLNLSF